MEENNPEQSGGASVLESLSYIVQLIFSLIACYLNWQCLKFQSLPIRVITTIMAFFFSIYYIVFYVVFKVILGKTC